MLSVVCSVGAIVLVGSIYCSDVKGSQMTVYMGNRLHMAATDDFDGGE